MVFTHRFEVEESDRPFEVDGKTIARKTVNVKVFDPIGKLVKVTEYGHVDRSEVYGAIKAGEILQLDHCYVRDISVSEYRKLNGIDKMEPVEIKGIMARHAFLDCREGTDFRNVQFGDGIIDLSSTWFGNGPINFYKTKFGIGDVLFEDCRFGIGDVNFQFSEFGEGRVSFKNTRFDNGNLSFVNASFGPGKVDFSDVDFGLGDVTFHYAKFGDGDISFHRCNFLEGEVDFRKVEFENGKIDFKRVQFGDGGVSFEESEFKAGRISFRSSRMGSGSVSFELCDFGSDDVVFEKVQFGEGKVSFARSKFDTLSFRGCHLNTYLDLRIDQGNILDLSDTIVTDIIDLKPIKEPVRLKELNITGIRNQGRIFIDWEDNDVFKMITQQGNKTTLVEKAEQFRTLKEDFNNTGLYDDEDKAYVEFKRFERRSRKKVALEANPLNAFWVYPSHFAEWLVFDKVGLYATNPIRVLFSMFVVYTAFSLTYYILPRIVDAGIACSGADNAQISLFKETFYFSAITFLTIGYGDCLPEGHIHWLAPVEGWVGVFMMSYFTVAFVRKVLR